MSSVVATLLKSPFRDLGAREALSKPTNALLGVSVAASQALAPLGIKTVFDLACSTVFATAAKITDAASKPGEGLGQYGFAPGDSIDDSALAEPLVELPLKSLAVLRAISAESAGTLSQSLDIQTLRDFALWPPYRAARDILNEAFGLSEASASDAESPQDLVPSTGRFPTERVQYEVMVLDRIDGAGSIPLQDAGPIDVTQAASSDFGFTKPAVGALLRFSQSWYTEGLALGQLLHTIALAPGESTRIAMIDWTRRTRAATDESLSQDEILTNTLQRGRAISEVVDAVANESQKGFSRSVGAGLGYNSGAAGGVGGASESAAATLGASSGFAAGIGMARSWASSSGKRKLHAEMRQNILDVTQQAANSSRNRRATIVREVSQQESERLSTRTITNYNHMHALSIEYYEIVQLYRVVVELASVNRCLFIPMKLVDFKSSLVVTRFRRAIALSGLTAQVRALANAEPNMLAISAPNREAPWSSDMLQIFARAVSRPVGEPGSRELLTPVRIYTYGFFYEEDAPFESLIIDHRTKGRIVLPIQHRKPEDVDPLGNHRVFLNDVFPLQPPDHDKTDFWDVTSMRLKKKGGQESFTGTVTVGLRIEVINIPGNPPVPDDSSVFFLRAAIRVPADTSEVTAFEMMRTLKDEELGRHLQDNALYYSQAIWSSLDAPTLGLLLSPYVYGGRPVAEMIDPTPLAVAGNYLVFRANSSEDDPSWKKFLEEHDLIVGGQKEDIVPLASGGVFAEAVLGRFNSAEKLDITRFWNWQDSPIPITPPEIAALQSGSRAQPENLLPGDLNPSVVNIMNPPSLPDPTGLGAAIGAISNGNMFRDMSGLAGTIGFAQAAMQSGLQGASEAARQAGANAATASQLAAQLLGGRVGQGRSGPTSPPTISNAGARINHGASLDQRGLGWTAEESGATAPISRSAELNAFTRDLGEAAEAGARRFTEQPEIARLLRSGTADASRLSLRDSSGSALEIERTGLFSRMPDLTETSSWEDLIRFTVPSSLVSALEKANITVQTLNAAQGRYVNMDMYPVLVTKLPSVNGKQVTPEGLLAILRMSLNDRINKNLAQFAPYNPGIDGPTWRSGLPFGAVMKIDIGGPDDAAVVVSYHDPTRWIFTTVKTPLVDVGEHPVSGNREFGFRPSQGGFVYYTRGVDIPTGHLDSALSLIGFSLAEQLWQSLQDGIAKYVTDNGGEAMRLPYYSKRHVWDWVRLFLHLDDSNSVNL